MSDKVDSQSSGNQSQCRGTAEMTPGKRVRVLPGHMLFGCEGTILWVHDDVVQVEVDLNSSTELELPSYLNDQPGLRLYFLFHINDIEVL